MFWGIQRTGKWKPAVFFETIPAELPEARLLSCLPIDAELFFKTRSLQTGRVVGEIAYYHQNAILIAHLKNSR